VRAIERRRAKYWLERAEAALSDAGEVRVLAEQAPRGVVNGAAEGDSNGFSSHRSVH